MAGFKHQLVAIAVLAACAACSAQQQAAPATGSSTLQAKAPPAPFAYDGYTDGSRTSILWLSAVIVVMGVVVALGVTVTAALGALLLNERETRRNQAAGMVGK